MGRLILVLVLLMMGALGAAEEPSAVAIGFEKALVKAQGWSELRPWFSAATLQALSRLTPAQQRSTWAQMAPSLKALDNPQISQQIKGSQAAVQLRTDRKSREGTTSNIRTYDLVLEGGAWKVDFQDNLELDEGDDD